MSLGGEVDGFRLLSQKTIDLIFQEQTKGEDLVLGKPIRFGMGYGLPLKETIPVIPEDRKVCFWGGWVSLSILDFMNCNVDSRMQRSQGGSSVVMDLDGQMTFTYVMNRMGEGTIG